MDEPVARMEHAARAREAERAPGGRPHDAVGGQPVTALELPDRALGRRAEGAVDRKAECTL